MDLTIPFLGTDIYLDIHDLFRTKERFFFNNLFHFFMVKLHENQRNVILGFALVLNELIRSLVRYSMCIWTWCQWSGSPVHWMISSINWLKISIDTEKKCCLKLTWYKTHTNSLAAAAFREIRHNKVSFYSTVTRYNIQRVCFPIKWKSTAINCKYWVVRENVSHAISSHDFNWEMVKIFHDFNKISNCFAFVEWKLVLLGCIQLSKKNTKWALGTCIFVALNRCS